MPNEATNEDIQTIAGIIKKARVALLATIGTDGAIVTRPMAVQDDDFDGYLWFMTEDPSDKTQEIVANERVNVGFETSEGFLSISGPASVVKERELIDKFWNAYADAYFDGRDDPRAALIRVECESAEYWSVDTPKPLQFLKIAQARAKHERPDLGENRTVEL